MNERQFIEISLKLIEFQLKQIKNSILHSDDEEYIPLDFDSAYNSLEDFKISLNIAMYKVSYLLGYMNTLYKDAEYLPFNTKHIYEVIYRIEEYPNDIIEECKNLWGAIDNHDIACIIVANKPLFGIKADDRVEINSSKDSAKKEEKKSEQQ